MNDLVVQQNNPLALACQDLDNAMTLSVALCKSGFAPRDLNTPDKCAIAMMHGAELGLKPMQAIQSVCVINGRPNVWGDAALAICIQHPDFQDISERIEQDGDDIVAICTVTRKGWEVRERRFSLAMAKKAGLWGKAGPWVTYPQRMLQMRARAWALRDTFADALKGFGVAEEAIDIQAEEVVSPIKRKGASKNLTDDEKAQDEKEACAVILDCIDVAIAEGGHLPGEALKVARDLFGKGVKRLEELTSEQLAKVEQKIRGMNMVAQEREPGEE